MLRGRSTRDEKFDYLDETDAEEKNVGSVIPSDIDAMGIRNDEGKVGGDANTPVFDEDDDAGEETFDELVEDEEADLKNIGIGIPGNLEHSSTERAGEIDEDALEEEDEEDIDDDATFNAGYTSTVHDAGTARITDDSAEGVHVERRGR